MVRKLIALFLLVSSLLLFIAAFIFVGDQMMADARELMKYDSNLHGASNIEIIDVWKRTNAWDGNIDIRVQFNADGKKGIFVYRPALNYSFSYFESSDILYTSAIKRYISDIEIPTWQYNDPKIVFFMTSSSLLGFSIIVYLSPLFKIGWKKLKNFDSYLNNK